MRTMGGVGRVHKLDDAHRVPTARGFRGVCTVCGDGGGHRLGGNHGVRTAAVNAEATQSVGSVVHAQTTRAAVHTQSVGLVVCAQSAGSAVHAQVLGSVVHSVGGFGGACTLSTVGGACRVGGLGGA